MLAESTSPAVISEGSNCVNTVTCMSPKLIGGATSPPSPCAKAVSTKNGIDVILSASKKIIL